MANPNLANVSNIYAKTYKLQKGLAINGSVPASQVGTHTLISNPSNSGKVIKVNLISLNLISNTFTLGSGSSNYDPEYTIICTSGGSDYLIASGTIDTSATKSAIALTKDNSFYIGENETLKWYSSTNNLYYNSTNSRQSCYYSNCTTVYDQHRTWGFSIMTSYEEFS